MQNLQRAATTVLPAAARCVVGVALLLAATLALAKSATELKILATDPAPDALLARQQPFFVRLEVQSAAPVDGVLGGVGMWLALAVGALLLAIAAMRLLRRRAPADDGTTRR